ncbi:MAG: SurA N-terminal domain-containing protein, partial [Arenimonas sp.]|nr:SurA N-terminal domain-containing protein [Arenimonas sp.]
MLQKIRDKSSGWVAKLILALIIAVMALFGLEQYLTPSLNNYAAKVTKPGKYFGMVGEISKEISVDEFRRRFDQLRQVQRREQGDKFNAAAYETKENKRLILEQMIDEAVLQLGAQQAGIAISDSMVRDAILSVEGFKVDGKFDPSRYQLALQQQGFTPAQFDQIVRQDLLTQFVAKQFIESGIASEAEAEYFIKLSEQKRNINYVEIPFPVVNQQASEADLTAWYNSHKSNFKTPETVVVEYVELDDSAVNSDLVLDDATLRQRYQEQIAQYSSPEQRVASHILVAVAKDASAADVAAAKAKAENIAKQAQANPASFSELAKNSDDIATQQNGGDLGPIEKGIYGDAFDAAFFALAPGQVSKPVLLPDGWHILYFREMVAGATKPFEEVKDEIASSYLSTEKERLFNDAASKMVNAVSENASSLEPAAKAANKPLLKTSAFTRNAGEGIASIEAIRKAAFSEELLVDRQVSDLIELEPNHVVILRVVDHQVERTLPLQAVKEQVRLAFIQDRAQKLADKEAKALLDRATKGETLEQLALTLSMPVVPVPNVTRRSPVPQLQPIIDEAFRLAKP